MQIRCFIFTQQNVWNEINILYLTYRFKESEECLKIVLIRDNLQ